MRELENPLKLNPFRTIWREHDIEYILTREPGGTKFGESIRSIILDKENSTDNITDSLLFYASRYENFNKSIQPALEKDKTVICDRFHYSTLVYQGIVGDNLLVRELHNIFDSIFSELIDNIIYLYTKPEESLERISRRNETDKFESRGLEYLRDLSNAYESVFSEMDNVIRIDTTGKKADTKKQLYENLEKIFY